MSCVGLCIYPPEPFLHYFMRVSKLALTFLSIGMACLCAFIIRKTTSVSSDYSNQLYIIIIVSTQFDAYSQLVLDPQYTTSTFCIYRDAPLINIPLNVAWGFMIWILLVTLHPSAYFACFLHRHQIIAPPDSIFKLNRFARSAILTIIAMPCLSYGYSYYV
ncbi:hypothetical protein PMAYCL1PPCAC_19541, partial [Pristionchus mayeri]